MQFSDALEWRISSAVGSPAPSDCWGPQHTTFLVQSLKIAILAQILKIWFPFLVHFTRREKKRIFCNFSSPKHELSSPQLEASPSKHARIRWLYSLTTLTIPQPNGIPEMSHLLNLMLKPLRKVLCKEMVSAGPQSGFERVYPSSKHSFFWVTWGGSS